jgi:hypothetical protein
VRTLASGVNSSNRCLVSSSCTRERNYYVSFARREGGLRVVLGSGMRVLFGFRRWRGRHAFRTVFRGWDWGEGRKGRRRRGRLDWSSDCIVWRGRRRGRLGGAVGRSLSGHRFHVEMRSRLKWDGGDISSTCTLNASPQTSVWTFMTTYKYAQWYPLLQHHIRTPQRQILPLALPTPQIKRFYLLINRLRQSLYNSINL